MITLTTASAPGLEDESPHGKSRIEWWFVQGTWKHLSSKQDLNKAVEAENVHSFMVSFFRQLPNVEKPPGKEGFWLLTSTLAPGRKDSDFTSMIDRQSLAFFLQAAQSLQHTNADSRLAQAYLQEVSDYGPPAPIRLSKTPAIVTGSPLSIIWDTFLLKQNTDCFSLSFAASDGRDEYRFRLDPTGPPIHLHGASVDGIRRGMEYKSYPNLTLAGTVAGESVSGHAWLDHQWGDLDWIRSGNGHSRLLGWTWFGISLNDGRRLLVTKHHDARRRRTLNQYLVSLEPGLPPRLVHHFSATPLRRWKSERSGVSYPVEWRLEIPELEADLRFRPLADAQEIPVLGIARSVWEGAGIVDGKIGRRPVRGVGRLELWGYGYIFNMERDLKRISARVATNIASYFPRTLAGAHLRHFTSERRIVNKPDAYTDMLSRPLWDLIDRKGKRWRPIFGLLLLEALGVVSRPYEQLISIIGELAHTGSLIVDDIEDQSRTRRGQPSIHVRYGTDVAINAANTAYFLPFLILRQHPLLSPSQQLDLYRILSEQFFRAHLGQAMDIYWSRRITRKRLSEWLNDTHGPKILEAYAHKSGSIVEGLAAAACVIAGMSESTTRACAKFARQFSVAFQILDDVSGFETPGQLRKRRGEDLAEGKLTYVMLQALKALPRTRRDRLGAIFCSPLVRRTTAGQREAMSLFRQSGALRSCREEALELFREAWTELALHVPPSEARIKLRALCTALLRCENSPEPDKGGAAKSKL